MAGQISFGKHSGSTRRSQCLAFLPRENCPAILKPHRFVSAPLPPPARCHAVASCSAAIRIYSVLQRPRRIWTCVDMPLGYANWEDGSILEELSSSQSCLFLFSLLYLSNGILILSPPLWTSSGSSSSPSPSEVSVSSHPLIDPWNP
ncbi:hypothetical protein MUK42_04693 [Musa troglodytarum]|uniref:Uncharacterized protein n=1 Tax=Musa troglodytarum TaxID=320322 RepID=A0A9E7KBR3_9LILI|nr:hypothetical protein MUK42_04693 [Musa troglodytarum]